MKCVQVLMSTYNGSLYLRQQIESILSQQGVSLSLLIRDDGSSDRTLAMLREYEKKHKNISVYAGNRKTRKGAAGSFFELLQHADASVDYFAFADQDDVWKPNKLLRAVCVLEKEESGDQPLLYAGKVIYASQDLSSQQIVSYKISKSPAFGNALMENICMGCTEVFNRQLLTLVREHLPASGMMHDWWMYLTAAYFGKVIYDQRACLLYRQHGNNEIGMHKHWGGRWLNRIRHLKQMHHRLSGQAAQFRDAYADLGIEDDRVRLFCDTKKDFRKRIQLACSKNLYRQNRFDDFVCRMLLMINFL